MLNTFKKFSVVIVTVLFSLFMVSCRDKKPGEEKHYNFYATVSTLPTTYSVLNTHVDNSESYVLFARRGTFGKDSLGENANLVDVEASANNENKMDIAKIGQKIKELYQQNNKSTFTFYVDDLNVQYFMDALINKGIPLKQIKVVILTDGTATYNAFESVLKDKSDDQIMEAFNKAKADYKRLLEEYTFGESFVGYTNGDRTQDKWHKDGVEYDTIKNYLATLAIAQAEEGFEVEWWVQYPECIGSYIDQSLRPKFYAEFEKANLIKIQPAELYNQLTDQAKVDFLDSSLRAQFEDDKRMGLAIIYEEDGTTIKGYYNDTSGVNNTIPYTKAYLDTIIYGNDNNKPVLIFSGTSASGMQMDGTRNSGFETTVKTIVKAYGDDYNIVFKPHPNFIPSGVDLEILEDNGITSMLPGRLPMELILYSYPGVAVGGYNSSLYMSAAAKDVRFFVGGLSGSVAYCFDPNGNASHVSWFSNPALESEIKK